MTMLRHAVVITSMEEDFRRIGLITDDGRDGDALQEAKDEADEADDKKSKEFGDEDYDLDDEDSEEAEAEAEAAEESTEDEDADEDEDEEEDAMAEAIAFHEGAKAMWADLGESGVETITLDEGDMAELEEMAAETTTLPGGVIDEAIDDEDEEPIAEDDDDEEADGSPFTAVAEAMTAIEAVLAEDAEPPASVEEATPAFANMALISEKLFGFYAGLAEADDDEDYAEISESFKAIAKYSAAIVDTLKTEDSDTINFDALTETFQDYLGTVLQGLETYSILREAAEAEGAEDEDEDEDEQNEDDEGNE